MSVWVGAGPISINRIPISLCSTWVVTAPISIGHSSFYLFEFESGPHLYRSTISLSCQFSFWDRTYINQSFIILSVWVWVGVAPISIDHLLVMLVQFLGPHLYRSVIILSVRVCVLGLHLYWSVIILSVWVWVEATLISIDHLHIILCSFWVFGTTPILIGHSFVLSIQFESGPHLYPSTILLSA